MSFKGCKHSEETKQKMSEAKMGVKRSPEHCAKMTGRKQSPETIAKRAVANTGRKRSEESKKRMSDAAKGRIVTEKTKQKMSESHKGDKSHFWKGGVSYEPYCILFNKEFKERVRNFFNCVCVECGKTEEENGRKLDVHHCNYHKDACCNNGVKPLFVVLCRSCHNKTTHGDREYYEERYTNLINTKYNGQSYLPKGEA